MRRVAIVTCVRDKTRARLLARIQGLLEPEEQIEIRIPAQSGVNPALGCLPGGDIVSAFNKYLLIITTNRAVVVLKRPFYSRSFNAVVVRLPRQTVLGPLTAGAWQRVNIPGMAVYVHGSNHKYVEMADAVAVQLGGQGTPMNPQIE